MIRKRNSLGHLALKQVYHRVKSFCIPLRYFDEGYISGTGLILNLGNVIAIVSAKHCFERFDNGVELCIPTDDSLIAISFDPSNSKLLYQEELDVGALIVKAEAITHLQETMGPIQRDLIDVTSQYSEESFYSIIGYPTKKNKAKPNLEKAGPRNIIHPQSSMITGPSVSEEYFESIAKDLKISKKKNIVIAYDRNDTESLSRDDGKIGKAFIPVGMSGSGIWMINEEGNSLNPKLIGIFTRYNKKHKVLIGSKIEYLTEALRSRINSAKNYLPENPYFYN